MQSPLGEESDCSGKSSTHRSSFPLKSDPKTVKKLPDLPQDLEPLKKRCTSMSNEVLQLLSQKVKEDMIIAKEKKDNIRAQQLRELSWKVTDMLALGSFAVKEIENMSQYQLQKNRGAKKYKNRNKNGWNEAGSNHNHSDMQRYQGDRNKNKKKQNRRGNHNQRQNLSGDNWRGKSEKFNFYAAKRFSQHFVQGIIRNSVDILTKEMESQYRVKVQKNIIATKDVIYNTIHESIKEHIFEAYAAKHNLSITETELLADMYEESLGIEENPVTMNVANPLTIKLDPVYC